MAQEECDELEQGQCLVTHFHQADCVNLASAMRAIITGFIERQEEGDEDELVIQCELSCCPSEQNLSLARQYRVVQDKDLQPLLPLTI